MKKQILLALGIAVVSGLAGASATSAQTTSNASVSLTIPTVLYINASGNFSYGQPGVADYNSSELAASNTITLTHKGNLAHEVQIKASADTMTYTGSATPPSKAVTDLQISVDGGSSWTPVAKSTTATLTAAEGLLVNSAAAGEHTKTASSKIALSYAGDPPGTYGASFTFTVVAD